MNEQELNRNIEVLQQNKTRWCEDISIQKKIEYIEQIITKSADVAERQVARSIEAKNISPDSSAVSEEWLAGPVVTIRTLRQLRDSLRETARYGHPQLKQSQVRVRQNGQVAVEVLPNSTYDSILYSGFKAEVWMQPDVTKENLLQHLAGHYQHQQFDPKVALILGAGNVASIAPLDAVYKLFVEGQVCLIKLNPVNDYLGPFLSEAFEDLIQDGFLRICYGGGDVGAYLCQHDGIEEIHITGSDKTHDLIVFGPGEEGQKRKEENRPVLTKKITSELGNVSPVVIIPGDWKESELQFHAENVLTQIANNAGFNCNAAKVLVLHKEWPQREAFLSKLKELFASHPTRTAYYPGAKERLETFTEGKHVYAVEPQENGHLPWTLIENLDPNNQSETCFVEESFCCLVAETSISATSTLDYLKQAVDFCNDTLHGTLSCSMIAHPTTVKELGPYFEEAIADLRYGSVVINHWPALSYGMGSTTWGAYPGHTMQDIQSGVGVVHNSFMFDKPEKSVIYGPFVVFPKPPWFVTNKNAAKLSEKLVTFESSPSYTQLPGIFWSALVG